MYISFLRCITNEMKGTRKKFIEITEKMNVKRETQEEENVVELI